MTGKLDTENLAADDFRHAVPRLQREALIGNQEIVQRFSQLAAKWQYSNAQLCLAWMLNKHPHVIPIAGTRREKFLMENVQAADIILKPQQIDELDKLFSPDKITGERYPEAGWGSIEI